MNEQVKKKVDKKLALSKKYRQEAVDLLKADIECCPHDYVVEVEAKPNDALYLNNSSPAIRVCMDCGYAEEFSPCYGWPPTFRNYNSDDLLKLPRKNMWEHIDWYCSEYSWEKNNYSDEPKILGQARI